MIVLALSSGTSVDAIDVAAADLHLEGTEVRMIPLGHREVAYSPELRASILDALPPASTTLETVCRIDTGIGREFAAAALTAAQELAADAADLVVSHGQTLFHWIEQGTAQGTLQLGQPAWIAEATGLPVVSDLRVNDVAAGGQGAPLASLLDALLLGERPGRSAALNLGGIANVTVVSADSDPVAFDTGPGNALLDAAIRRVTDGRAHVDQDGALAAQGKVDEQLLGALLDHPYYRLPPPKSTGKEEFHAGYLGEMLAGYAATGISPEDLLATLVELTARSVSEALAELAVEEVFASGGGTRNAMLMRRLADNLAPTRLSTTDELGLDTAAKEAYLFALLGFLTWHGLPGTVACCTGAHRPTVAGRITPGGTSLRLPDPAIARPTVMRIVDAPLPHPNTDGGNHGNTRPDRDRGLPGRFGVAGPQAVREAKRPQGLLPGQP